MTTYIPSAEGLEPGRAWDDHHPCENCGWTANAHNPEGECPPSSAARDRRRAILRYAVRHRERRDSA